MGSRASGKRSRAPERDFRSAKASEKEIEQKISKATKISYCEVGEASRFAFSLGQANRDGSSTRAGDARVTIGAPPFNVDCIAETEYMIKQGSIPLLVPRRQLAYT
jgi:hypothetical protein